MPTADPRLLAAGRTAEIYAWEPGLVLKLYRPGFQEGLPEFELEVMRAVTAAGIQAPRVGDLVVYAGRKGIPMTYIEGESLLAALRRAPWKAAAFGCLLAEIHARMHTAPGTNLPPQRARLESKIRHAAALPEHLRQAALSTLADMPQGDRLCHGDFHPDNVIETPGGPMIIDWVDVTSGNPLADVARTALLVRHSPLPPGSPLNFLLAFVRAQFYNAYLKRYFELAPGSPQEVAAWLPLVAAARLSEDIPGQERNLLSIAARLGST